MTHKTASEVAQLIIRDDVQMEIDEKQETSKVARPDGVQVDVIQTVNTRCKRYMISAKQANWLKNAANHTDGWHVNYGRNTHVSGFIQHPEHGYIGVELTIIKNGAGQIEYHYASETVYAVVQLHTADELLRMFASA